MLAEGRRGASKSSKNKRGTVRHTCIFEVEHDTAKVELLLKEFLALRRRMIAQRGQFHHLLVVPAHQGIALVNGRISRGGPPEGGPQASGGTQARGGSLAAKGKE